MEELFDQVKKRVKAAADKLDLEVDNIELWEPTEKGFGDLSTNVAMMAFKDSGRKNPLELAEELAGAIKVDEVIEKAEAIKPGFLNFTLQTEFLVSRLPEVFKSNFGKVEIQKPEKVNVEFISANPTGPLTMGNARGGFVGDVIANVLKYAGNDVAREYYFNDAGTQVGKLAESVRAAGGKKVDGEVQYSGEYVDKLAKKFVDQLDNPELGSLLTEEVFKEYIQGSIDRLNIRFDKWFNEKDLVGEPFDKAIKKLQDLGLVYEADGALWLKSTELGDERDRVLRKTNGDPTYLANDIPYHLNILEERGFDRAIKVWGADHAGQIPSLRLTVNKLLPGKELEFVIVQWVRLIKDGQEFKMSKRAGTYVTTDELLELIGGEHPEEVARWFFISRSHDTHMDFDLDLARDRSEKNPIFYAQYAHARIAGILRQSSSVIPSEVEGSIRKDPHDRQGRSQDDNNVNYSLLKEPEERELIKRLLAFPEVVREAAQGPEYPVHKLPFYAQELSADFHRFYHHHQVLTDDLNLRASRLMLVKATESVLKIILTELVGVRAPEKM
jgi:arginyl-tRNA synthetase